MSIQASEMIAGVMLVALILYALMAGADFGGGVWDLLASGSRKEEQRKLIFKAMGPIWEANHVWLILLVVLMFTCFPDAFAAASIALHVPLVFMLVGIVFRGASFVFRIYDVENRSHQKRWETIFAISSFFTPLMLGMVLGASASGELIIQNGNPVGGYFRSWLQPFPMMVGLFSLCLFAYLAAIYLACEAKEEDLVGDFRRRAMAAGILSGGVSLGVMVLARSHAPEFWQGLVGRPWSWPLQACAVLSAFGCLIELYRRHYFRARLLAVLQVSLVVTGWAAAQYPYLIRPNYEIESSAAPTHVLNTVLSVLAVGALILFPSLYYLFRVFKGQRAFLVSENPPTE